MHWDRISIPSTGPPALTDECTHTSHYPKQKKPKFWVAWNTHIILLYAQFLVMLYTSGDLQTYVAQYGSYVYDLPKYKGKFVFYM